MVYRDFETIIFFVSNLLIIIIRNWWLSGKEGTLDLILLQKSYTFWQQYTPCAEITLDLKLERGAEQKFKQMLNWTNPSVVVFGFFSMPNRMQTPWEQTLDDFEYYLSLGEENGISLIHLKNITVWAAALLRQKRKNKNKTLCEINIVGDSRTEYLKWKHLLENMIRYSGTKVTYHLYVLNDAQLPWVNTKS